MTVAGCAHTHRRQVGSITPKFAGGNSKQHHAGSTMIEGGFDARTLFNMCLALNRVCGRTPLGEQHEVRKRIAQGIVRCAMIGRTTAGPLTEAGERALVRIPERDLIAPPAAHRALIRSGVFSSRKGTTPH